MDDHNDHDDFIRVEEKVDTLLRRTEKLPELCGRHDERICAAERDIERVGKRIWYIVAGIVAVFIGVMANLIK